MNTKHAPKVKTPLKKGITRTLWIVLLIVGFAIGLQAYIRFVIKQVKEHTASINTISDNTSAFTYGRRNDSVKTFTFDLPTTRDILINTWQINLLGSVMISITNTEGTTLSKKNLDAYENTYKVHLKSGKYTLTTHFSNAIAGGCVIGLNHMQAELKSLPILVDTDQDGLSDQKEHALGTNPERIDTDADSLSDYLETIKYKTNPLLKDSDKDGRPDSYWNERREYAYTVRVLLLLRPPFDPVTMNDDYQDVRLIDGPDKAGYSRIEAIIYPETHVILSASSFPIKKLSPELKQYTQPGIATNYNDQMRGDVLKIVANSQTDVMATERILKWMTAKTQLYLDYSIREVSYTYVKDGKVYVRHYDPPLSAEELLRTHYFADSMFKDRVHGTCTSIATLKCAMLKAAGIPCRLVETIHPIYYHDNQKVPYPYENKLRRPWECNFEQSKHEEILKCNHAFLEVYLGNRWIRVDDSIGIYREEADCLNLKILSVADWGKVDFSKTWSLDWINQRPYYTQLIEDQEPK